MTRHASSPPCAQLRFVPVTDRPERPFFGFFALSRSVRCSVFPTFPHPQYSPRNLPTIPPPPPAPQFLPAQVLIHRLPLIVEPLRHPRLRLAQRIRRDDRQRDRRVRVT